jgi:hypothetical protein
MHGIRKAGHASKLCFIISKFRKLLTSVSHSTSQSATLQRFLVVKRVLRVQMPFTSRSPEGRHLVSKYVYVWGGRGGGMCVCVVRTHVFCLTGRLLHYFSYK